MMNSGRLCKYVVNMCLWVKCFVFISTDAVCVRLGVKIFWVRMYVFVSGIICLSINLLKCVFFVFLLQWSVFLCVVAICVCVCVR